MKKRAMPAASAVITGILEHHRKKPFTWATLCKTVPKSPGGTVSSVIHFLAQNKLLRAERLPRGHDSGGRVFTYTLSPRWASAKYPDAMAERALHAANAAREVVRKHAAKRNGAQTEPDVLSKKPAPLTAPGNFLDHWAQVNKDSLTLRQIRHHLVEIGERVKIILTLMAVEVPARKRK